MVSLKCEVVWTENFAKNWEIEALVCAHTCNGQTTNKARHADKEQCQAPPGHISPPKVCPGRKEVGPNVHQGDDDPSDEVHDGAESPFRFIFVSRHLDIIWRSKYLGQ